MCARVCIVVKINNTVNVNALQPSNDLPDHGDGAAARRPRRESDRSGIGGPRGKRTGPSALQKGQAAANRDSHPAPGNQQTAGGSDKTVEIKEGDKTAEVETKKNEEAQDNILCN